jgi:hypothetical protein
MAAAWGLGRAFLTRNTGHEAAVRLSRRMPGRPPLVQTHWGMLKFADPWIEAE